MVCQATSGCFGTEVEALKSAPILSAANALENCVEGCASLLALDAKRAMRPVLAAHRDRGFGPGEIMTAGPIRFAWTRRGEAEPWAAVDVSLALGPDHGQARLTLEHQAGRRTTGPHVHYRGEAPMLQDVLGGRVACAFHSMTGSGDHIRAGRIRPLAALGRDGIPSLPRVPTFASLGYSEDFARSGFVGVFAPARTPEPALARLVEAFRFAMGRPEVLRRLAEMDTIAQYLPPAEFREDVADYMRFWSGLVDRMDLRVEG